MTFFEYMASGLVVLLAVYLAARLVSAAYFKSKSQYERQKP